MYFSYILTTDHYIASGIRKHASTIKRAPTTDYRPPTTNSPFFQKNHKNP